jgi:hypothetical protein
MNIKYIYLIIITSCISSSALHAEESLSHQLFDEEEGLAGLQSIIYSPLLDHIKVDIQKYGYVKLDTFYDSRQVFGGRQNQAHTAPKPVVYDRFCRDINDRGQFHMTAVESRFGFKLTGPKTSSGLQTSGGIQGDFRAVNEPTTGSFRLRLAFGKVEWPDGSSILFGEFWHPLFILECYPHTVDFSIGAPIELQAREPQVKFTKRLGVFEVIGSVASQSLFTSDGPEGFSSFYIQNSMVPNTHGQVRAYFGEHMCGIAVDFKRLVPRLVTNNNVKTDTGVNSVITEAFATFNYPNFSFRSKVFYAQNGTEQQILGGYGVRSRDPDTNIRTYNNISAAGGWIDMSYLVRHHSMEIGIFTGAAKLIDKRQHFYRDPETDNTITYGFIPNGEVVFRTAPRLVWAWDPIRLGLEVWYSRARFGCFNPDTGTVTYDSTHNVRALSGLYYIF